MGKSRIHHPILPPVDGGEGGPSRNGPIEQTSLGKKVLNAGFAAFSGSRAAAGYAAEGGRLTSLITPSAAYNRTGADQQQNERRGLGNDRLNLTDAEITPVTRIELKQ